MMGDVADSAKVFRRGIVCLLLGIIAVALSGCGSNGRAHTKATAGPAQSSTRGPGVPASAVAVIDGWANALRTGHLQQAAGYWAHPSAMVNGVDNAGNLALIQIRTLRDALGADESLPCGATLKRTTRNGRYVKAVFALGARVGVHSNGGCSGVAAVDFLIGKGQIERWLRAPLASSPAPGAPGSGRESVPATSV
jgi:hypothetical protein